MTTKTIKIILFAGLIIAIILPFLAINYATAETDIFNKTEIAKNNSSLEKVSSTEPSSLQVHYGWLISIISGAIVAGIFELILVLKQLSQRKKQVKIIKKEIIEMFSKIKNVKAIENHDPPIAKSHLQYVTYTAYLQAITLLVDTFQNSLKIENVLEIRKTLHSLDILVGFLNRENQYLKDEKQYDDSYNEFKKLRWLGLEDLDT